MRTILDLTGVDLLSFLMAGFLILSGFESVDLETFSIRKEFRNLSDFHYKIKVMRTDEDRE